MRRRPASRWRSSSRRGRPLVRARLRVLPVSAVGRFSGRRGDRPGWCHLHGRRGRDGWCRDGGAGRGGRGHARRRRDWGRAGWHGIRCAAAPDREHGDHGRDGGTAPDQNRRLSPERCPVISGRDLPAGRAERRRRADGPRCRSGLQHRRTAGRLHPGGESPRRRADGLAEGCIQLVHRRPAIVRPLGQCLEDDRLQLRRNCRVLVARWRHRLGDVHQHDVSPPGAHEGRRADQHLVDDDPQGVDVGAVIDLLGKSTTLFGRHVGRRAHHRPCLGLGAAPRQLAPQLGDAEVEHLHAGAERPAVVRHQEQVVGLEVAMNDLLAVRRLQRPGRLRRHVDGFGDRETAALDPPGQALPVEELHHHVGNPGRQQPHVDDVDDVRVVDGVGGPRLVHEPLDEAGVLGQLWSEHLDGGFAPHERVFGQVDGPHAALSQDRAHLVVVDSLADQARPASSDLRSRPPSSRR